MVMVMVTAQEREVFFAVIRVQAIQLTKLIAMIAIQLFTRAYVMAAMGWMIIAMELLMMDQEQ